MWKRLIAGVLMFTGWVGAQEKIDLKVERVTETRVSDLSGGDNFAVLQGLQLVVKVAGEGVAGATKFGKTKLTEATADTGESLLEDEKGSRSMTDLGFVSVAEAGGMWGGNEQDAAKGGFNLTLQLKNPPRVAKSVKSIKGTFTILAGGEETLVEVDDPKSQAGKMIEDPALKAAGLTLRMLAAEDAGAMGGQQMIQIELTGGESVIADVQVLNAAGDDIKQGSWRSESGAKKQIGYMLSEAPDEKTVLQLKLMIGQKAIEVPIDLNDIKLP